MMFSIIDKCTFSATINSDLYTVDGRLSKVGGNVREYGHQLRKPQLLGKGTT